MTKTFQPLNLVWVTNLLLVVLLASSLHCQAEQENPVVISNASITFRFDPDGGTYSIWNETFPAVRISNACFGINSWKSSDPSATNSCQWVSTENQIDSELQIHSSLPGGLTSILEVRLPRNSSAVHLRTGLINNSSQAVRVMSMTPLSEGWICPDLNTFEQLRILSGEAGDGNTRCHAWPGVRSCNNLLMTFRSNTDRYSLLGGGLDYQDWVKFAQIGDPTKSHQQRINQLQQALPKPVTLLAYRDCGNREYQPVSSPGYELLVEPSRSFEFPESWRIRDPWSGIVTYATDAITLKASGLTADRTYQIGFSIWNPEGWSPVPDLAFETVDGSSETVPVLLDLNENQITQAPLDVYIKIPESTIRAGSAKLVLKNLTNQASNLVLSEAWLMEAHPSTAPVHTRVPERLLLDPPAVPNKPPQKFCLWAEDPLGRLVLPGETYLPSDSFYLGLGAECPFEMADDYGAAVGQANHARPNQYNFPTLCGWYAAEPKYGGGPTENTTLGLVREMEQIAQTGILQYSPVAVRLVPDDYGINNQQGWWDDQHWQQYGHYQPPFETSSGWAAAIKQRGGIPLTYLQPGLISRDYAMAFPEHLLFDGVGLLDKPFSRKQSPVNYDYTDPGFQRHLKEVYRNLANAGVEGLMFDYPHRCWNQTGGMEDRVTTAAAAYRKVYQPARTELGTNAWLHERILRTQNHAMPMTDLAVGLVDSQRVWGDTDDITYGMYSRCGLRWYKQRSLFYYDMDAKNFFKLTPNNRIGRQQLLTMAYTTGNRLLLSSSFAKMTPEMVHDLSRLYPLHTQHVNARPVDAFNCLTDHHPLVYLFTFSPEQQVLVLLNPHVDRPYTAQISLSGPLAESGLNLSPSREYHIYDFWNHRYVGLFNGGDVLQEELSAGEARVLAITEQTSRPQIISTNRHLMQGVVDLGKMEWDGGGTYLSGTARTVPGEVYRMQVARNGFELLGINCSGAYTWVSASGDPGSNPQVIEVCLLSKNQQEVDWQVDFVPLSGTNNQ